MFRKLTVNILPCVVIAFTITGCAPFATYPPIAGSLGIDNPEFEPVPSIMAGAIGYAHNEYGGNHKVFINLPQGTTAIVYQRVIDKLGEGKPMTSEDQWAYHIKEVRSRGLSAQVDLIYTSENGSPVLVTIRMRKTFEGYRITTAKKWNIPTIVPPPAWPTRIEESEEVLAAEKSGE